MAVAGELAIGHTTISNLDFARNWYFHLKRAGLRNYALIATDDDAHAVLSREVAGHVVRCPQSIYRAPTLRAAQSYKSRGWTRLMFAVPRMLRWVLSMGLHVLWMDTDVVAVRNPFPLVHELAASAPPGTPLVLASVDGRVPDEHLLECGQFYTDDSRWGTSSGMSKLCGGLFYIRSTPATVALVWDWEKRVRAPTAGKKNQPHFNDAVVRHARSIDIRLLPCAQFPNGHRFANALWRRAQPRSAVLVHNNWIKGHQAKRLRFQEWGMWLTNASSLASASSVGQLCLKRQRSTGRATLTD